MRQASHSDALWRNAVKLWLLELYTCSSKESSEWNVIPGRKMTCRVNRLVPLRLLRSKNSVGGDFVVAVIHGMFGTLECCWGTPISMAVKTDYFPLAIS